RHRIPLPTHPLNPKHHWLHKPTPQQTPTTHTLRRRDDLTQWMYAPSWQRVPLSVHTAPDFGQHWLVFADEVGVGDALGQRLRAGGATVTVVKPADEWHRTAPDEVTLRAGEGDDYRRLIDSLASGPSGQPTRIVHSWTVTAPREEPADETAGLRFGFDSLVHLAQALGRHGNAERRRIWVLSNGVHNVTGTEGLAPAKATLLGPSRVLPREMTGTTCRCIDLDCVTAPTVRQVDRLMSELAAEPEAGCETVAHRGSHRWLQHYLPHPLPLPTGGTALRPGGVYLVTGGTGGLGLALAEHICAAGGRVALTTRTPLPPAEEWDAFLARQSEGPVADTVRRLVGLRDSGAQLLVLRADVADPEAMSEAVARTVDRWGVVNGAFHAAGVPGGGLVQLKDLSDAAEVMRPKVRGTLVLEQALAGQDLDFLVLFGSNGANIGSVGQVDYCAANCFLDAFAQDRGRHRRVISIDWGPWKGLGMTVKAAVPPGLAELRSHEVDERGMTRQEGLRVLEAILTGSAEPQVIVSPSDLTELLADAPSLDARAAQVLERAGRPDALPRSVHARPALHTEYVPPRTPAEHTLCEVWQDLLGIEAIGIQDSFFALGGDSLTAIQLVSTANARLQARLTLGDLYDGLTVAHLAELAENRPQPETRATEEAVERRRENLQKRRQHQQRRRKARGQG
ncbi:SDR family NAD(P)-dependent oxidoreductase, partial [Streptomyces sp. NPDC017248]|uniref:SDR family NAD(P)-dependent oxidoreductase n=1 Tax=unclassified Streptomyces TaxID=2593676 RepID=UPI003790D944